jgi:hypothetical protein
MRRRSSRRLAGCIVIELAAAAGLAAVNLEYQAGTAGSENAQALALEDRGGHLAVMAQAGFAITRSLADLLAAQVMKTYGLERGAILLRGAPGAPPVPGQPQDLIAVISAALGQLNPARVLYDGTAIAVITPEGRCLAEISAAASLAFADCSAGKPVGGPIRSAFQMAEPVRGLRQRSAPAASFPVAAVALGNRVAILALGGEPPPGIASGRRATDLLIAPFSNDNVAPPDDPQVRAAIQSVLARVGRGYSN